MSTRRIAWLKGLDRVLGGAAVSCVSLFPQPATRIHTFVSILVIRPGGIGDGILLAPTLSALKRSYPQAKIHVLAEKRNAAAFQLCPQVDLVLRYDRPRELLLALRNGYDLVMDTEQWHRLSAVMGRLCRPKLLAGFGSNDRIRLLTHATPYRQDDYEADSFLNLLTPLGIVPPKLSAPFLAVPESARQKSAELLAALGDKPFITIFPGASIPERRWGAERFARVAELLRQAGLGIVVIGGGEDREQGDIISGVGKGLNLAGRTSLAESAAIIATSALLVSGDSGVLHMAVGVGTPTVALFGPGREKKWAPRGANHSVINKRLPCSPCTTFGTTPPCPDAARCMGEISVDEVADAALRLLAGAGVSRRAGV